MGVCDCCGSVQILMLYWLSALIVAVKKALFAGHITDQRSDSEDSDDDHHRKAATRKKAE